MSPCGCEERTVGELCPASGRGQSLGTPGGRVGRQGGEAREGHPPEAGGLVKSWSALGCSSSPSLGCRLLPCARELGQAWGSRKQ